MARLKFQTLTEQMFYTLLCLKEECCGMDILETKTEGRRRSYILTEKGQEMLTKERDRLAAQLSDYQRIFGKESLP